MALCSRKRGTTAAFKKRRRRPLFDAMYMLPDGTEIPSMTKPPFVDASVAFLCEVVIKF